MESTISLKKNGTCTLRTWAVFSHSADRVGRAECGTFVPLPLRRPEVPGRPRHGPLLPVRPALRAQLCGLHCLTEGEGGAAPTFGHRYRDISLIIPQSAFRCSWVVSSASASKGAFRLGFVGSFFAPTAEAAPVFPSTAGVFLGPLCWSMDVVEAKPRAVRIRAESSDGQRRGALRAIGRRTQAESIWGLEFCRIYGRERGRFTPRERLSRNDADPEPHGESAPPAARKLEYATDARKASGGGGRRCIQSAIVIDFPIPAGSDPHRCFSARPRGAVEPHYVDTAIPRNRETSRASHSEFGFTTAARAIFAGFIQFHQWLLADPILYSPHRRASSCRRRALARGLSVGRRACCPPTSAGMSTSRPPRRHHPSRAPLTCPNKLRQSPS